MIDISNPYILALLAMNAIAVVAGPFGCFIVWRRLSYFADSLAHSVLFGVALGIAFHINLSLSVFVVAIAVALSLRMLQRITSVATDSLLGMLSTVFLSAAVVTLALVSKYNNHGDAHGDDDHDEHGDAHDDALGDDHHDAHQLEDLLFGDILQLTSFDVIGIYVFSIIALGVLFVIWRPLFASGVSEEIANVENGVKSGYSQIIFIVFIAMMVAFALEIIGALLITAMLIIPAIAARTFSRTPEQMGILSAIVALVAANVGIVTSLNYDIPPGPTIVATAFLCCMIALLLKAVTARGR